MYYYTFGNRSDYRNIFASLLNILRGIFFNISALTPYPLLDPSGLTPFTRNPSNSWNSFLPGATLPHVIPPPSMSGTHSSEQLYTSSLKRKCPAPSLVPRFLTVRKGRHNLLYIKANKIRKKYKWIGDVFITWRHGSIIAKASRKLS